jgi:NADH:ubiquinone oxidoreductase subunit 3 (subunit A)
MKIDYLKITEILIYESYLTIFLFILYSLILSIVVLGLSYVIAIQNPYFEKVSAYECGFEPFEDARNQVDVSFCIVAILFLIFDIEVLFLFPWCLVLSLVGNTGFWAMISFLLLLGLGFLYEIVKGALNW